MEKITISIISVPTDLVTSGYGNRLSISGSLKSSGYFTNRIFASEAEAQIAKGILLLLLETKRTEENIVQEYEFLLKATLRLCYSTKTWSE